MTDIWFRLRTSLGRHIGNRLVQILLHMKTDAHFSRLYGDFHFGESLDRYAIKGLAQESGKIYGAVAYFLKSLPSPPANLFLPGENNQVKPAYARLLNLDVGRIVTAGILQDMDVRWNFEEDPPLLWQYDCIVSQSMLEHLLDPYKHVRDCVTLLRPGGHLILHTMMPGFNYHRYPIDCMRFYPDWFEEIAKRMALIVVDKYIHNARITYLFRKSPFVQHETSQPGDAPISPAMSSDARRP